MIEYWNDSTKQWQAAEIINEGSEDSALVNFSEPYDNVLLEVATSDASGLGEYAEIELNPFFYWNASSQKWQTEPVVNSGSEESILIPGFSGKAYEYSIATANEEGLGAESNATFEIELVYEGFGFAI